MTLKFREKSARAQRGFPTRRCTKQTKIIKNARGKISTRDLENEPLLGPARDTLDRHLVSLAKLATLEHGGQIIPDDFQDMVGLTDTAVEEAKTALREAQIETVRHGASRVVTAAPGQALDVLEKWDAKAARS